MATRRPLRWLKLYGHETIHGTTTKELEPGERWCWIGYLSLASLSPAPGTICVAEGLPYTTDQLSRLLAVTPTLLKRATDKMVAADKISVDGAGIHILNWSHYQGDYVRKQNERARVSNVTPPPGVTNVTDRGRGRGRGERGEEDRSSSTSRGDAFAAFVTIYEDNIGVVVPSTVELLDDLYQHYSVEWFRAAVKEAIANNARSLTYVKAILERWNRDGFKTPLRHRPAGGAGARRQQGLPDAQQLKQGWERDP